MVGKYSNVGAGDIEEKIISTALCGYGIESQRLKCLEELSELSKELCKAGLGEKNKFHIAEEIADVLIMLKQMCHYYGIETNVELFFDAKLRQLGEKVGVLNAEE